MQNVASGDVRCLISICRTGQFLLHVFSELRDMARKKKTIYQTTNQQLELHVHTNNSPKEKHLPCYIRDFIIGK